jgi:hypothetical protein
VSVGGSLELVFGDVLLDGLLGLVEVLDARLMRSVVADGRNAGDAHGKGKGRIVDFHHVAHVQIS